jgi:hypothetical protein
MENREEIDIKGVCSDEGIEIYNRDGEVIVNCIELGEIFIG